MISILSREEREAAREWSGGGIHIVHDRADWDTVEIWFNGECVKRGRIEGVESKFQELGLYYSGGYGSVTAAAKRGERQKR